MAYHLDLSEAHVLRYFRDLVEAGTLSTFSLEKLLGLLEEHLGQRGDVFREDPGRRISHEGSLFYFEIVLMADGAYHHFWFAVNDAPAEYGILRVEYAERKNPPPI